MNELEVWVLSLSPGMAIGLVVVLLAGAVAAFVWGFRAFHRARLIGDTPTSKVRSAVQGYVELEGWGKTMDGDTIVGPLTQRPCIWFRYKVQERRRHHRDSDSWITIDSGTSNTLFQFEDDTGECVIDPEGAEVTATEKEVWYGNHAAGSYGLPSSRGVTGTFSGERYCFTEERIGEGSPLYVLGVFSTVGGSQEVPDTRTEVRQLLRDWKRDQASLLQRFDANGDGQIDLKEWSAVQKAALNEVLRAQRERMARPGTHLLSRPRRGRRPFILSAVPQEQTASRYRYQAIGGLIGFFFGLGATLWVLVVRGLVQ